MGFIEEIIHSLDKSLIVNCWKYIFPILVVCYLIIFLYDKHLYGGKKNTEIPNVEPKHKIDGIEYVGGTKIS